MLQKTEWVSQSPAGETSSEISSFFRDFLVNIASLAEYASKQKASGTLAPLSVRDANPGVRQGTDRHKLRQSVKHPVRLGCAGAYNHSHSPGFAVGGAGVSFTTKDRRGDCPEYSRRPPLGKEAWELACIP